MNFAMGNFEAAVANVEQSQLRTILWKHPSRPLIPQLTPTGLLVSIASMLMFPCLRLGAFIV